ncbi:hypothetical protein [Bacillus seohaeanensis]|uniref:Uncharacterized protein n=1 Tax=Bacillus seohaeanensis TaxID=284580 RepID=A0ABW5RR91_9BACI
MEKQYIEFILQNEDHVQQIERLSKLWEEHLDCVFEGIETTTDGVFVPDSEFHKPVYIEEEIKRLVEDNYYFDHECDPYYVIEDGYNQMLGMGHPSLFIDSVQHEKKRRHTRKRHPKKSWEKLKALGLEE